MVTRIRTGKSLKGAVNYNENKVKEGSAELLMVNGYPKDAANLNFHEKLKRLEMLAALNTRTTTNCVHISVNFDVTEKLSKEMLIAVTQTYMEKIGFGQQPYNAYEHYDAAHQHVHVVTTNIQKDGKRISLHNLGSIQSEKARKEIEVMFDLVKAGEKQRKELQLLKPVSLEKVAYGKTATHRAIKNIVTGVVTQYKFGSLAELNAVLQLYNVKADRGNETSRMYAKNGLQYTLLNERGEKVGIPIKASSIDGRPTMVNLEKQYETNKQLKEPFKYDTKNIIDQVLQKQQSEGSTISKSLHDHGIDLVLRKNADGFIYGVTYVDHNTRCVFNGSELGKQYSAAVIREMLNTCPRAIDSKTVSQAGGQQEQQVKRSEPGNDRVPGSPFLKPPLSTEGKVDKPASETKDEFSILKTITDPINESNYLPWELKRKRKRRRPRKHL